MPETLYEQLIRKHTKNGVFLDTNLLLLLLVGWYDDRLLPHFVHTKAFVQEDYLILKNIVSCFNLLYTTPNVLTEASNLTKKISTATPLALFRTHFAQVILALQQVSCSSAEIARKPFFIKLGLTDAGIIEVAKNQFLTLTTDFPLYQILSAAGTDVINFNHLRPFGWQLLGHFGFGRVEQ